MGCLLGSLIHSGDRARSLHWININTVYSGIFGGYQPFAYHRALGNDAAVNIEEGPEVLQDRDLGSEVIRQGEAKPVATPGGGKEVPPDATLMSMATLAVTSTHNSRLFLRSQGLFTMPSSRFSKKQLMELKGMSQKQNGSSRWGKMPTQVRLPR